MFNMMMMKYILLTAWGAMKTFRYAYYCCCWKKKRKRKQKKKKTEPCKRSIHEGSPLHTKVVVNYFHTRVHLGEKGPE